MAPGLQTWVVSDMNVGPGPWPYLVPAVLLSDALMCAMNARLANRFYTISANTVFELLINGINCLKIL